MQSRAVLGRLCAEDGLATLGGFGTMSTALKGLEPSDIRRATFKAEPEGVVTCDANPRGVWLRLPDGVGKAVLELDANPS